LYSEKKQKQYAKKMVLASKAFQPKMGYYSISGQSCSNELKVKNMHNKSLYRIFTTLRSVKTSDLNRWL